MSNDLIICAVVAAVFNRGIKYRILIQPPCIWYGLKILILLWRLCLRLQRLLLPGPL